MKKIINSVLLVTFLVSFSGFSEADAQSRIRINNAKITFLRVHEVETGFGGGATNQIDVEVVIKLNKNTDQAFGFKLRDDNRRPVHQGMLDILRDAFNYNHNVNIVYDIDDGDKNGIIVRIELIKAASGLSSSAQLN